MIRAARAVDQLNHQLFRVGEVLETAHLRVDEHFGSDASTNDRASALLAATALMLTDTRRQMDQLTDQMLHACPE